MMSMVWLNSSCNGQYEQGRQLYLNNCANCHMDDGSGLGEAIPALTSKNIMSIQESLPCLIRQGREKNGIMVMTAHPQLNSVEVTNIINYITEAFAQTNQFVNPQEVKLKLESCQ